MCPGGCTPPRQTPPPGQTPDNPLADTPQADTPPPRVCHCNGRHASYWNAFLYKRKFPSIVAPRQLTDIETDKIATVPNDIGLSVQYDHLHTILYKTFYRYERTVIREKMKFHNALVLTFLWCVQTPTLNIDFKEYQAELFILYPD